MDSGMKTVTLSGLSLPFNDLPFVASGTVGATDKNGITEVKTKTHIFYVGESSISYRPIKGKSGAASPQKELSSFNELKNLKVGAFGSEPQPIKEKALMQINVGGKLLDIAADVAAVLQKLGQDKEVIELSDYDDAVGAAEGDDLTILSQFEETIAAAIDEGKADGGAGDSAPSSTPEGSTDGGNEGNPAGSEGNPAGSGDGGTPDGTPPNTPPATPPQGGNSGTGGLGGSKIGGSSVFTQGNKETPNANRKPKTEAEKEAIRLKREQERREVISELKESTGTIEQLHLQIGEHQLGSEALQALRRLMLVEGHLPLFSTLVNTNTRVRAEVHNNVKPEDRVYHPLLQGKPGYTATGKDIKPKYAQGDYDVLLRESSPSVPSGFFVYIPEGLRDFTPSKFSHYTERQKVVDAAARIGEGKIQRVLKYYAKTEIVRLLILLEADMVLYNGTTNKYVPGSPTIFRHSKLNSETGDTTYSLRAANSSGKTTKLSIRRFIPVHTFNSVKVGAPNFDAKLTTTALFHRLLMHIPDGTPANKFSQLSQKGASMFHLEADGSIVFNGFTDTFHVPAYDNVGDSNVTVDLPCPLVVWSNPTTQGAAKRPQFSRSKYTEPGYSQTYKADLNVVLNELKSIKRVTNRSTLNSNRAEIANLEGINRLLSSEGITIR